MFRKSFESLERRKKQADENKNSNKPASPTPAKQSAAAPTVDTPKVTGDDLFRDARQCNIDGLRSKVNAAVKDAYADSADAMLQLSDTVKQVVNMTATRPLGATALHGACISGHTATVEFLLQSGANVNHTDGEGNNVMHLVCMGGKTHIAKALLAHAEGSGAANSVDMTLQNKGGWTPLAIARERKCAELCELIQPGSSASLKEAADDAAEPKSATGGGSQQQAKAGAKQQDAKAGGGPDSVPPPLPSSAASPKSGGSGSGGGGSGGGGSQGAIPASPRRASVTMGIATAKAVAGEAEMPPCLLQVFGSGLLQMVQHHSWKQREEGMARGAEAIAALMAREAESLVKLRGGGGGFGSGSGSSDDDDDDDDDDAADAAEAKAAKGSAKARAVAQVQAQVAVGLEAGCLLVNSAMADSVHQVRWGRP